MRRIISFVLMVSGVLSLTLFSAVVNAAPVTNATTATVIAGTTTYQSNAIASDEHFIWQTNSSGGSGGTGFLTKVNIDTSVATVINDASFQSPQGVASSGTYVFIANKDSNTVSRLTIATGAISVITNAAFQNPIALIFDGKHAWVGNNAGGIVELDAKGVVLHQFTDPSIKIYDSLNAELSSDGTNLWAASVAGDPNDPSGCKGGCLIKIDIASQAVVGVFSIPPASPGPGVYGPPQPDSVYSTGTEVYFADNNADQNLYKFVIASGKFSMVASTGSINDFYSITSDGSNLYLGNSGCQSGPVACIPVANFASQAITAISNATLDSFGSSSGMVTWSRGCLWWSQAYSQSSAIVRLCDSVAPPSTTTTTTTPASTTTSPATTTTQVRGLAATGIPLGIIAGSGLLVLASGLLLTRRSRRTGV
jgi:hypothetical protein